MSQTDLRVQLLTTPKTRWRAAKHAGRCTSCGTPYQPGTAIKTPHWNAGRYVAECCAEDQP